jgi:cytochrome c oxidase subunit 2
MHRIEKYEKAFLWLGAVLLVACMGVLAYASLAMGISLPGRTNEVDPATMRAQAPFDNPGIRQTGPNSYEVVMIGQVWAFLPNEIRVPAGSEVTFVATSNDVIHGVHVEGTRVNMMLIPGQVVRNTYVFKEPGEHLLICHEYCGVGHHTMYGKVIVE